MLTVLDQSGDFSPEQANHRRRPSGPDTETESSMSKVILFVSITADGVMQAPGRPDEDRRGGFAYGGWATPYADSVLGSVAGGSMGTSGAVLLGRRTYETSTPSGPTGRSPTPSPTC